MPILAHPTAQQENNLRAHLGGASFEGDDSTAQDLVVVSGRAFKFDERLTGDPDSDYAEKLYQIEMFVGPRWRGILDVSPIAMVTGFNHWSSDGADATGYSVEGCDWELGSDNGAHRILLTVALLVRGGPDCDIHTLSYHLTAIGSLDLHNPDPL